MYFGEGDFPDIWADNHQCYQVLANVKDQVRFRAGTGRGCASIRQNMVLQKKLKSWKFTSDEAIFVSKWLTLHKLERDSLKKA